MIRFFTSKLLLALLVNQLGAAVTYDFTDKASTYDGETSVIVSILDTETSTSTNMTVTSSGLGNLNSNSTTFGVDSSVSGETAANIDFTDEEITLTFDKDIIFNFIDFNGVGDDISTGVALTVGGSIFNLYTGETGFNGNDKFTPTSPISVSTSQSIVITGSGASSSFYIQNFSITVSAVPEPNTYALLAGILTLGFVSVRRRKS